MVSNTCDYFDRFSRVARFSYLQKVGYEIRFAFCFFLSLILFAHILQQSCLLRFLSFIHLGMWLLCDYIVFRVKYILLP
jgi:hypothetical protein